MSDIQMLEIEKSKWEIKKSQAVIFGEIDSFTNAKKQIERIEKEISQLEKEGKKDDKKELTELWERYKKLNYKRNRYVNKITMQDAYSINEIEEELFEVELQINRRLTE